MTLVVLTAAPAANGWVEVHLIGDGGKPDGALVLPAGPVLLPRQARVKLDSAGSATVELRPTSGLTPAGMVYRATFTGNGTKEDLTFGGFSGVGPVNAGDYRVSLPSDIVFEDGGGAVTGGGGIQDGGGA